MIDAGKRSVLGVSVDAVDYEGALARIIGAAEAGEPLSVSALAVHGVMSGVQDLEHRSRLNELDLVTPDGQPVRWALNLLHGARLRDRVYGPELTLCVLREAAARGLPVFLYGSSQVVLGRLADRLRTLLPHLVIAGLEPSKFRELNEEELKLLAERVRRSGARIALVGLGCPRQETWVWYMRRHLSMPMLAVGAAFDYHAGLLRRPPSWMQRRGLEWLWRLFLEPRRLWRRYLLLNPAFLVRLFGQRTGIWRPEPTPPSTPISTVPG